MRIEKEKEKIKTKVYEGRTFESYDGIHWDEVKNGNWRSNGI